MITRAQAEALLTLAESLEACERLGVTVEISEEGKALIRHPQGGFLISLGRFGGVRPETLRMMIHEEMPKQER